MPATSHPRTSRGAGRRTASAVPAPAMTSPGLPCRLVLPDGRVTIGERSPEAHVRAYLRAVVAPQDDIAHSWSSRAGPRQRRARVARWPRENFHDPADHAAILAARQSATPDRGQEMFCGIVPQDRARAAQGGRRPPGACVWVDIDRKSTGAPRR